MNANEKKFNAEQKVLRLSLEWYQQNKLVEMLVNKLACSRSEEYKAKAKLSKLEKQMNAAKTELMEITGLCPVVDVDFNIHYEEPIE